MLKNEEKVTNEKQIIKKEKKQIKTAKKALVEAEKKLRVKPSNVSTKAKKDKPKKKKKQPAKNTMTSMTCFYIVYKDKGANGETLALEVGQEDKYAPKKTGVLNVDLQNYLG